MHISYLSKAASAPPSSSSSSTGKLCCHSDFHFMLNKLNCCAIDSSNHTHWLTWAARNGLCSTYIYSRRVYVICQYVSIFARETMTKNSPNVIVNQKAEKTYTIFALYARTRRIKLWTKIGHFLFHGEIFHRQHVIMLKQCPTTHFWAVSWFFLRKCVW